MEGFRILSDEHSRPKEAHVHAALEAACEVAGIVHPDDEPLRLLVFEEIATPDGQPKRHRQVSIDNSPAHNAAHGARRALEEGYVNGAEHRRAKEAHLVLGDSIAYGTKIQAALEAARTKAATERQARVEELAKKLKAAPASAIELAQKTPADELADALKLLGVEVPA